MHVAIFSWDVIWEKCVISPKTVLFPLGVRKTSLTVTGREIKAWKRCTNCRGEYQLQFLSPQMMRWKWQYFFIHPGERTQDIGPAKNFLIFSYCIKTNTTQNWPSVPQAYKHPPLSHYKAVWTTTAQPVRGIQRDSLEYLCARTSTSRSVHDF